MNYPSSFTQWVEGRTRVQTQAVRLQILKLCDLHFKMMPVERTTDYSRAREEAATSEAIAETYRGELLGLFVSVRVVRST